MNYALQLNSNTKLSHSNLLFIPIIYNYDSR